MPPLFFRTKNKENTQKYKKQEQISQENTEKNEALMAHLAENRINLLFLFLD